jgi:hypothetical protein
VSDIIPDIVVKLYTDIISDIASDIVSNIVYDISQAGLIPPLEKEVAGIITGSEAILKEFASMHSLNASRINALIKDVVKNPAFNADEVDTDMLQRLRLTFRFLTCTHRRVESKFWICLSSLWKKSCTNSRKTCAVQGPM